MLLCDGLEQIRCLGTSNDLYAGQAVDRVGVSMGFGFPAGVMVSETAQQCQEEMRVKVSVKGINCNLSGLENQCNKLRAQGKSDAYVCKYCHDY